MRNKILGFMLILSVIIFCPLITSAAQSTSNDNVSFDVSFIKINGTDLHEYMHLTTTTLNNRNTKIWFGNINKDTAQYVELLPVIDENSNLLTVVVHFDNNDAINPNLPIEIHCKNGDSIYLGVGKNNTSTTLLKIVPTIKK